MAGNLAQGTDPFEAALHELRGALVDLDGDGRPDATMPIPPAAKAIQYIDDHLGPPLPPMEESRGNAMQVAQGGPVMTDDGYLSPQEQWSNVTQTQAEQPSPERPPQQNAMMRYLSNSAGALSRIPGDLWDLVPSAERGPPEPGQSAWEQVSNSPAAEFVGNVLRALPPMMMGPFPTAQMGLSAMRTPGSGAAAGEAARRAGRGLTPTGRMANTLDDVATENAMMKGRLNEAGRPSPAYGVKTTPEMASGRKDFLQKSMDDEIAYGKKLRDATRRMDDAVSEARSAVEQARQTPYVSGRVRDAKGRYVSKEREIRELEKRAAQTEKGTGKWDTGTAVDAFRDARKNIRGFNEAVDARDYRKAAEMVSRKTGTPVDVVEESLREWYWRGGK